MKALKISGGAPVYLMRAYMLCISSAHLLPRTARSFDVALMSLFRMSLVDYDYGALVAHDDTMGV